MNRELTDIVRRIKDAADIVAVVGRVVTLKKAGATYKGLCPFHQEKTPSFNVVPAKGIFHCFGCGVGGSVIDFVMKTERLEFREALERLAHETGIELPSFRQQSREEKDAETRQREAVQQANEEALKWLRRNLLEGRNRRASEYLPERGISAEMSERFQLGAATDEWDGLKNHLLRLGFSEDLLADAGLCVQADSGRLYDRFRNRLIFPILDANGRVSGFGGRQLVEETNSPKYLNSAETILYKKSNMLYALNLAKQEIVKSGFAILCEGYMDVLMAHAHGFPQAVASLGTALTMPQARLLKRFANRTYFLYDGDSAGQKAMLRGGEPLLEAGFDTRVIALPPEHDPDSFLRKEGAEALQRMMGGAEEFFDYALRLHAATVDLNLLAGQAELAERMAPVINVLQGDVMREAGIARLLKKLGGLPREAVTRILKRARTDVRTEAEAPARTAGEAEVSSIFPGIHMLDLSLLKLMVEVPDALEYFRMNLRHEWVIDPKLEGWIFYLLDHEGFARTLLDHAEATSEFPGEQQVMMRVLAWDRPVGANAQAAAEEILWRLHERHQLALTRELLGMIDQKSLGEEEANRILAAYHHEHRQRLHVTRRLPKPGTGSTPRRYMPGA